VIAGTCLLDPNFVCKDGTVQNKIIVLLSDGISGTYVTVKITSRSARYGLDFGCQILGRFPCFFLPQGSCCLDLHSWIQLDAYYEFDASLLERKVVDGKVYQIGTLDAHIRHLLICAINSEDISSSQEKLLQAALAALPKNPADSRGT
jgi:hypothetical protein